MSDLKTGQATWFDLPAIDLADAMSFYEGLFGWAYVQMNDSPLTDYVMVQIQGTFIGGIRRVAHRRPPEPSEFYPILYFTVENLDLSIGRAKDLGAQIVGTTVALGKNRGRYQWIRDREGHLIGLWAAQ